MKMIYQHKALEYHNPDTGEYDENEKINPNGELLVECSYEVCNNCGGHGTHFRRDLDENRLYESMLEDGDEDGIEAYYNGAYDCVCNTCKGLRVVQNPTLPEWAEVLIGDWYESEMRYMAECKAERMAGA
jgi:hypothetical protein